MTKRTNFDGSLGTYRWEITEDGSYTLYSEYFQENCHSTAGATSETLYNYIYGTEVPRFLAQNKKVKIFEVGFGTGIGLHSTCDFIEANYLGLELSFISSELDRDLAHHSLLILQDKGVIQEINWSEKNQQFYGTFCDKFATASKWKVLVGDIRLRIEHWRNSSDFEIVDCIYQDAFSPKRSPSLWTHQWFTQLANISGPETIMSTYCSAKAVWKAMVEARWSVEMVKGHGAKKLSTRAYFDGRGMKQELIDLLERSPTPMLAD